MRAANHDNSHEYVTICGSRIPPADLRCCGRDFKDHLFYLKSAEAEANRLVKYFGCNTKSRILDVGCGQGRLPIGILRVIGNLDYCGIDVDSRSIRWCNAVIGQTNPGFRFFHVNVYNERYNTAGLKLDNTFHFDFNVDSFDIAYLFSVISHLTEDDIRTYLKDLRRILSKHGKLFFTAFVENNVPNISINPSGYVFVKCSGALHVVRYNKSYLFSIIEELGYRIDSFTYATETDGQSAIYLSNTR